MVDAYEGRQWQTPIWNKMVAIGKYAISCLPDRVRGILYEYNFDEKTDPERMLRVLSRMLPRLNIVEIVAQGSYGAVSSLASDTTVLYEYMLTGTFASKVIAEFSAFLRNGGFFLDIGANIGLTTIPVIRNENVRCLAFEPDPVNFALLERNIARNKRCSYVTAHQIALFDRRDTLRLAKAKGNIGDHRINLGVATTREIIEVKALPLDDFLDRIEGPLAVKIDTQGAEPYIIAGGQKMLARADLLAIEFCPFLIKQMGGDVDLVLDLISSFSSVAVIPGGVAEQPNYVAAEKAVVILKQKLESYIESDGDYLDILARR